MSRDDGFTVMDVSSDIANEPKFRKLHRDNPQHVAAAFMAYLAVLGESWKAGKRVSVTESWPAMLPFDAEVVASMVRVHLVERSGLPPRKAWEGWYRPAFERRAKARDRWARYNAQRNAVETSLPRGTNAATASSGPSGPSGPSDRPDERDTPPPPTSGGRRKAKTNPRAVRTDPRSNGTGPRDIGTSPRQERERQKRGPTRLHEILTGIAAAGSDT